MSSICGDMIRNGECFRGRCLCDPDIHDACDISAPMFKDLVCNGFTTELVMEDASVTQILTVETHSTLKINKAVALELYPTMSK